MPLAHLSPATKSAHPTEKRNLLDSRNIKEKIKFCSISSRSAEQTSFLLQSRGEIIQQKWREPPAIIEFTYKNL